MKKSFKILLILYMFFPLSVFAYSKYIIPSGKNIGIELKSDYILVVGEYKVNNKKLNSDIHIGDKIIKINNKEVNSIKDMQSILNSISEDFVSVTIKRNEDILETKLNLYLEDNVYKTGLYVRDTVRGVATLTYIDKKDDVINFGALGHEILEKNTKSRFDANSGTIFYSEVTNVKKSNNGSPGEKNARSNSNDVYGNVLENTESGIFGVWTTSLPNNKFYKVANPNEIELGGAKILTSIKGDTVSAYDINIMKINENSNTKNILFEVTDKKLLEETGGIIQGMSGSPIIQGDNIIGAVNYVLVDSPDKGYGIFITNMLEEAEN